MFLLRREETNMGGNLRFFPILIGLGNILRVEDAQVLETTEFWQRASQLKWNLGHYHFRQGG